MSNASSQTLNTIVSRFNFYFKTIENIYNLTSERIVQGKKCLTMEMKNY